MFNASDSGKWADPAHVGQVMDLSIGDDGEVRATLNLGTVPGHYETAVWLTASGVYLPDPGDPKGQEETITMPLSVLATQFDRPTDSPNFIEVGTVNITKRIGIERVLDVAVNIIGDNPKRSPQGHTFHMHPVR